MGGEKVYRVVWEPLLRGKFGTLADEIAAVWFWNKLNCAAAAGVRAARSSSIL